MFKVGLNGVGAEDFGPAAPTITQKATQAVVDVSHTVEDITGIKNIAYYLGVALIGWVGYQYLNEGR